MLQKNKRTAPDEFETRTSEAIGLDQNSQIIPHLAPKLFLSKTMHEVKLLLEA